ncbi:protein-export chaperone SecB [Vibrio fluvialis]|nr:protein-export chaperone SecB [Vibrio fluvialis]
MWDLHSIQLENINFLKTAIEVNKAGKESEPSFSMKCAHTEYDKDSQTIGVKVIAAVGYDDEGEKLPTAEFWMDVEVEGVFHVNAETFPVEKLHLWAKQNAPLILYPYVREAAYSLTSRTMKDSAAILPLLTVPTIKTDNEKSS